MEERQVEEKHDEGGRKGNVVKFTRSRSTIASAPLAVPQTPQDPPTDQELAEYRLYWPMVKQMLKDFERIKQKDGCPVMRSILGLD